MANVLFSNNATSLLQTTISAVDTTIELAPGFGARFPSPSGGTYFMATLEDDQGNFEIVRCTLRATDLLTVTRGQDNSTAQAFTQNVTRVELRLVAAVMGNFLQVDGDVMLGSLDMAGNNLIDAVLSGGSTQILAGEVVNVPIRGTTGVSTNEFVVPTGGGRATVGGLALLAAGDDLIPELDVAGIIDLNSATVGVQINDGYLQVGNPTETERLNISSDDAGDIDFLFTGVTDVNWTGANLNLGAGVVVQMNDEILDQPYIQDFALVAQTVSGIATTVVDYELGSYVRLNLTANISVLDIQNPPISPRFGTFRFKITQDATPRTITWPASFTWPQGIAPTLSAGSGAIDFVDAWTDDGGVTWYAAYNANWS